MARWTTWAGPTEEPHSIARVATRLALTVDEILSLPDDGYRHELVYGVHYVSPAPAGPHQVAVVKLAILLSASCPSAYQVIVAPFAWVMTDPDGGRHEVQPDLLVVTAEQARRARLEEKLPHLVVEVLSAGAANQARDLEDKFALYQAVGVPAYWVLDPEAKLLRAWNLAGSELVLSAEARADQSFRTDWPWPVSFQPDELT